MIHQQHGSIVFVEFDVGLVHDFSPGLLAKRLTLGGQHFVVLQRHAPRSSNGCWSMIVSV